MRKKKILITIDWFLPGTKSGGPVRSYANILDYFGGEHDFYVIARDTDYCETKPYTSVESNSWNDFNGTTKIYYISEDKLSYFTLKKIYKSIEFDIILINGIYSWYFSILPLWILKSEPLKKIVSARGMLNSQAFSSKRTKKKLFLKFGKLFGLYKNIFFHATNKQEETCIYKEINKSATVIIAPNLPRKIRQRSLVKKIKHVKNLKLVSIARISKEKGTLTALRALISFKEVDSIQIEYDLYGTKYDLDYWDQCSELIAQFPSNIKVTYKGSIDSNDVLDCFKKYHFLLMPSEGENFGHAILESLSVGTPVIISDNTPWKNLEEKRIGWDIYLNNPLILKNVLDLAIDMEQEKYNKWSENAFNFAREFCNNEDNLKINKKLFNINLNK